LAFQHFATILFVSEKAPRIQANAIIFQFFLQEVEYTY